MIGPCPYGQVVAITPYGSLSCMKSKCPSIYNGDYNFWKQKPLVPTSDGKCYELGSTGRCSKYDDTSSPLGLDVLKNELVCIDITDPSSPFFSSQEENDILDSLYENFFPEYDLFQIYLVHQSLEHANEVKYGKKTKASAGTYERRQSSQTTTTPRPINSGLSRVPSVNYCGPGTLQGKCNPIIKYEIFHILKFNSLS